MGQPGELTGYVICLSVWLAKSPRAVFLCDLDAPPQERHNFEPPQTVLLIWKRRRPLAKHGDMAGPGTFVASFVFRCFYRGTAESQRRFWVLRNKVAAVGSSYAYCLNWPARRGRMLVAGIGRQA